MKDEGIRIKGQRDRLSYFNLHPSSFILQALRKFRLKILDTRQTARQCRWQRPRQFVVGNTDGFIDVAQGIFREDAVLRLAQDEADGGRVLWVAELVIDHRAVEIHLAGVFGLEVAFLEIDHNEAAQMEVVEEQVEIEVAVADLQPVLAAHEGEAASEFDQKGLDVRQQAGFELALVEGLF